jgi:peptidoglycan-N-acetylglucosamine deacetylase
MTTPPTPQTEQHAGAGMSPGTPGYRRPVERRRFLALFGMAGAGAAGGAAALATQAVAGAADPEPQEDPRREQPDLPNRGSHRVVWAVDTTEPVASITFDDGPDPEFTPEILEILRRYDVRTTFFMMGWNASTHPDLARAVVDAGHEIGNHTWTHLNLTFTSPEETFEEIHRGADVIEDVTGVRPLYFRPPRGQMTGFSIRHATMLGTDTIMWSVTRGIPGPGTPEQVRQHLAQHLGPGDIVNLHDGLGRGTFNPGRTFTEELRVRRQVEVEALPAVIEDALGRGLRLGTVSDVLAVERPGSGRPEPVDPGDVASPSGPAGE